MSGPRTSRSSCASRSARSPRRIERLAAQGHGEVFAIVRAFIAEVDARLDERMGATKMRHPRALLEELGEALASRWLPSHPRRQRWRERPPNDGGGTNPEQLFAVGYAACFEGAIGVVGRREMVEVGDVSIDSQVSLVTTEERGFKLDVVLDVTLPQVQDPDVAERVVRGAHRVCPYSHATRGNVDVAMSVNGKAVS